MTLPSASRTDATSFAATDIADRFLHLRAGIEEQLHTRLDVVDVPVADRPGPGMPLLWPCGSKPMC